MIPANLLRELHMELGKHTLLFEEITESHQRLGELIDEYAAKPSIAKLVKIHDEGERFRCWAVMSRKASEFTGLLRRRIIETPRLKSIARKWSSIDPSKLYVARQDAEKLLDYARLPLYVEHGGGAKITKDKRGLRITPIYTTEEKAQKTIPALLEPFLAYKADLFWHTHHHLSITNGRMSQGDHGFSKHNRIPLLFATLTLEGRPVFQISINGVGYNVRVED